MTNDRLCHFGLFAHSGLRLAGLSREVISNLCLRGFFSTSTFELVSGRNLNNSPIFSADNKK